MSDDLSARLHYLEDQLELTRLMNRYRHTSDIGDFDAWGECWTEDAVIDLPAADARIEGRAAAVEAAKSQMAPFAERHHVLSNTMFEIGGDEATGVGTLMFIGMPIAPEAEKVVFGGHYDWRFRRTPEGWRLAVMTLRVIWHGL